MSLHVKRLGEVSVIELAGSLDETFETAAFVEACARYTIVDFDGVRGVTSYGVKEWLTAIRQLPASTYVCFVRARPSVAMQFNLVVGFGGPGELLSLYAPFVCPSTGDEQHVLLDLRKDYSLIVSQALPEPECHPGERAEFDDIPETYFSYVVSRPPPNAPAVVSQVLDGASAPAKSPFSVDKDVFADVTALRLRGRLDKRARLKRVLEGLEGAALFLLDELEELETEAARQLAPLLASENVAVAFARVPHGLVTPLLEALPHARRKVLSVVVDVNDVEGTPCRVELSARDLASLAAGTVTSPTSGLPIACNEQALVAELEAVVGPAEEAFEAYLERRGGPPSRAESESGRLVAATAVQSGTRGYEILELVGSGGMADIFLAVQQGQEGFRKKVILKKIRSTYALNAEYLEMFLQEARIAARLAHPNIAQILDLGHRGDDYFIALEYVEGADLRKLLTAVRMLGDKVPLDIACLVGTSLAAALVCAHEARDDHGRPLQIVHRDVSPKNILVSKDGIAKLTDFGVASMARSFVVARPGVVKGTTAYMAPEQALGDEPLDPAADVFAAGIVLYECMTGIHPFRRATEEGTFTAILQHEPQSPRELRPEIPESLDRVVMLALEKTLDRRCRSARELGRMIEQCVGETGAPATATRLAEWVSGVLVRARAAGMEASPASRSGSASKSNPDAETKVLTTEQATGTLPSALGGDKS